MAVIGFRFPNVCKYRKIRALGEARPNGVQLIFISKNGREGTLLGASHWLIISMGLEITSNVSDLSITDKTFAKPSLCAIARQSFVEWH